MTLFLDQRYADLVAPYLEGHSLKSSTPYRANCRCPLCGDSMTKKSKKRGWILQSNDGESLIYYCHNCNASLPFGKFLENINPSLHQNYEAERKLEFFETLGKQREIRKPIEQTQQSKTVFNVSGTSKFLQKISQLKVNHPVRKYVVEKRLIPSHQHFRIFYCRDFPGWINTIIPGKLPIKPDPRLVLPIANEERKIVGVAARSLLPDSDLRYINIMFDESYPKTYGLDRVDWDDTYYVVEGAIDSFFLPNCIAINGSAIDFKTLKNPHNAVLVLDNQCRDRGVIRTLEKAIEAGLRVCIWPTSPAEKEDINQMVQKGLNPHSIIEANTYNGLVAKMKLNAWKRITKEIA